MRAAFKASALCVCLSVVAIQATSSQTPASSAAPGENPAATAAADDAAAKHAKRTACLAQAKAQKLVGAEKTAYLKNCIDAP